MKDKGSPDQELRVAALCATPKDFQLTCGMLGGAGIESVACTDLDDICKKVSEGAGAILVIEEALSPAGTNDLSRFLAGQPYWSDIPLLVLARAGADSGRVAAAMERLGTVVVLERPVRSLALISAVRSALQARKRQYQVRDEGELLRESEERFRTLFESAPMAVFACDRDAVIQHYNENAARLWGREPECGVERHCGSQKLWLPDGTYLPHDQSPMVEVLRTGNPAHNVEVYIERPDGSRLPVIVNFAALKDGQGQISGAITSFIDITERKVLEDAVRKSRDELEDRVTERTAELAEANRAVAREAAERAKAQDERLVLLKQIITVQEDERRRIARDMHDHFGQQLTAMRLNLNAVQNFKGLDDTLTEKLAEMERLAESLDSDVSFLVWELRPTALDDLGLKAAVDNYVRKWSKQYNIAAAFHGDTFDDKVFAAGAATNLYRIVQESLTNVSKHARATKASVVIKRRDNEVILIVEDNGRGVELATQKRTGLGLKGMRERADLIGGRLEIESAPGKGTTIYVTIPIEKNNKPETKNGNKGH